MKQYGGTGRSGQGWGVQSNRRESERSEKGLKQYGGRGELRVGRGREGAQDGSVKTRSALEASCAPPPSCGAVRRCVDAATFTHAHNASRTQGTPGLRYDLPLPAPRPTLLRTLCPCVNSELTRMRTEPPPHA